MQKSILFDSLRSEQRRPESEGRRCYFFAEIEWPRKLTSGPSLCIMGHTKLTCRSRKYTPAWFPPPLRFRTEGRTAGERSEERDMEKRETFSSRLGFVLISAGCAIGLGNVWRFPYITGKYGGAAFVLLYLLFLIVLGLPVMR